MYFEELNDDQRLALAQCYLLKLADEGTYAEVVGVEWDAPSYGELANALSIVPADVLEHEYGDIVFTEDDFDSSRICCVCGKYMHDGMTDEDGFYCHEGCFAQAMDERYGIWRTVNDDGCGGYYEWYDVREGKWEPTGIYYTEWED